MQAIFGMRDVNGDTNLDPCGTDTEQLSETTPTRGIGDLMGFLDKAKAKAEELAKQAKPAMQQAKEKAGPMADKMKEGAGQAAKKAKAKADEMRDNRKTDGTPPPPPPA